MRAGLVVGMAVACSADATFVSIEPPVFLPVDPPSLGPDVVEDVLRQRIPARVDVLWVVDNSSSMLAEQQQLAKAFPAFLDFYVGSGLDWQVGVISTDTEDPTQSGKLQGGAGYLWVDPSVPDPVATFEEMALLGRDGSAAEKGRRAIWQSLTDPEAMAHNAGFFRDDARLTIVIVSDENDATRQDPTINTLGEVLTDLDQPVTISAIITPDPPCGINKPGTEYRTLVEATGGLLLDICSEDWSPLLAALGVQAGGLSRTFYLPRVPVASTLEVWVEDGGQRIDFAADAWSYDPGGNAIVFASYTPRAAADVHVRYTLRATLDGGGR